MTANQYRAALDKLGLTQAAAGRLFKIGERTGRRWATEGSIPETAAILLRLTLAGKITLADIEKARK